MTVEYQTIRRSRINGAQVRTESKSSGSLDEAIETLLPLLLAGDFPVLVTKAEINRVKAIDRALARALERQIDRLLCKRIFTWQCKIAEVKTRSSQANSTEATKFRRQLARLTEEERLFRGTLFYRTIRQAGEIS
jgi:hypothetical protein